MRFIIQGLFAMLVMFWLAVIIAETPADATDNESARYKAAGSTAGLPEPLAWSIQGQP